MPIPAAPTRQCKRTTWSHISSIYCELGCCCYWACGNSCCGKSHSCQSSRRGCYGKTARYSGQTNICQFLPVVNMFKEFRSINFWKTWISHKWITPNFVKTRQLVSASCRDCGLPGKEGCNPLFRLYRFVPLNVEWFPVSLVLNVQYWISSNSSIIYS